eukprot:s8374_g3.t1
MSPRPRLAQVDHSGQCFEESSDFQFRFCQLLHPRFLGLRGPFPKPQTERIETWSSPEEIHEHFDHLEARLSALEGLDVRVQALEKMLQISESNGRLAEMSVAKAAEALEMAEVRFFFGAALQTIDQGFRAPRGSSSYN